MGTITDFEEKYGHTLNEYEDLILENIQEDKIENTIVAIDKIDKMDVMDLASSHTEVYTSSLLDWYREDKKRLDYIDDAIDEGLTEGMHSFKLLMVGNFMYHQEHFKTAKQSLKNKLEEFKE